MDYPLDTRIENAAPCGNCGKDFPHITGWVESEERTVAAYIASCHRHTRRSVAIDVVLGPWGEDADDADRFTFSCQVRPSSAMALDAPQTLSTTDDVLGTMLSRDQALDHPLIDEFWMTVDSIVVGDPLVRSTLRPLLGRFLRPPKR